MDQLDPNKRPEVPDPEPLTFEAAIGRILERFQEWGQAFIELLPNIVVAVSVVVTFALIGRFASYLVRRGLTRVAHNEQLAALTSAATRLTFLAVGVLIGLGLLNLDKALTSLLAGVGIVGLALGFAFQDIAANFMSGSIMAVRQPFELGDLVETHGYLGTVERVSLRATVLRLFSGQEVILPNKDVLQNPITNYSRTGERRVDIDLGVAYDSDLERVREVAVSAIEGIDYRDVERAPEFYYTEFGDSAVGLSVRFWLDLASDHSNFLEARSRGIEAVRRAFADAELEIPFPIRTVELGPSTVPAIEALSHGNE